MANCRACPLRCPTGCFARSPACSLSNKLLAIDPGEADRIGRIAAVIEQVGGGHNRLVVGADDLHRADEAGGWESVAGRGKRIQIVNPVGGHTVGVRRGRQRAIRL